MAAELICPHCGNVLRTSAALAPGQKVRCPACQQSFAAGPPAAAPQGRDPTVAARAPGRSLTISLTLFAILVVVAAAALLAAYVWPGFLRSTPAPHIEDPLALLPPQSNWVLGADLDRLRERGALEPTLNLLMNPPPGVPIEPLPAGLAEAMRGGSTLLVAGTTGEDPPRPTLLLTTRAPADAERIKRLLNANAARQVHGFTVYRAAPGDAARDSVAWLTFPGERLVVLSQLPEPRLAALLAEAGKHPPHPAGDLMNQAKGTPLWAALHFDDRMKQSLRTRLPAGFKDALPVLERSRGAIATLDFPEQAKVARAKVEVFCASEEDADRLAAAAQKYWNANKALLSAALLLPVLDAPVRALIGDVTRSLKVEVQEGHAVASVELSEKTLRLLKAEK